MAWEVCWQLGGIYTVLKTKAQAMQSRWGERYFLVGPYNRATAEVEFEPCPAPEPIATALDRLARAGQPAHFGRWLVPGRPHVILLDFRARGWKLAEDKYLLFNDHGIATPNDGEINDVISLGFAAADFFRELAAVTSSVAAAQGEQPMMVHCHEWMGGVVIPRIAHLKLPIKTVFTTHATLLGRYLAGDNPHFYDHLPFMDADAEAKKYGIYPKYQIEKAAAHASTVFTTVSEVTAVESQKLLHRTPDVLLPNGLGVQKFAAQHEFQNLHLQYKQRIHEFVRGHFFPNYTFDLDNTLYLVTSGRYEYRNKGMDLYIESLYRLNQRLKGMAQRPTVVAFIITRAPVRNINIDVLKNQAMFEDLRAVCRDITSKVGDRLFDRAAVGKLPDFSQLLGDDDLVRLKRAMHATHTGRQPTIVTHDMVDDSTDAVLRHLRHRGLLNGPDDPVKVIFHPDFMTATSPLMNLDYEQFVRGCHMGVFPSYYEPWGYTPMECVVLGVPTVTTDLSGFGAYVIRNIELAAMQGIYVMTRRGRSFEQSADELTDHLFTFCQTSRRQRIEQRNRVESLSDMFDWKALARYYAEAHELAMQRGAGISASGGPGRRAHSVPGAHNQVGRVEVRML